MIGRGTLASVLNNALGALLGLLALNFVTAYGGRSAWGMWLYAFALVGVLAILTHLGYPQAYVHRVSAGHPAAEANATFLLAKLALTAVFGLVALGSYWVATGPLGRGLQDTTLPVLLVAAAYYAALSLRTFFDSAFQAQRLFALYESVQFVDTIVTVPATMTAALVVGRLRDAPVPFPAWADAAIHAFGLAGPVGVERAAYFIALGFLAGKVASLLYALAQFLLHGFPLGRPSWRLFRSWQRYAVPLTAMTVFFAIGTQFDRVFLGFFWTPEIVADYGLALQLLTPILVVSTALGGTLFPTASQHYGARDAPGLRRILLDAERYLSLVVVALLMLAFVFAPEAVRVVTSGRAFDGAIPLLRLLVVFVYFTSLAAPMRSLALGFDQPGLLARLHFFTLLALFSLGVVVIPPGLLGLELLGLAGLGAATLVSLVAAAGYVWLRAAARRIVALPWLPPDLARQLAAAFVAGAALWWLRDLLPPGALTRAWPLAAFGVLGLALYLALLVPVGALTWRDLRLARGLLHPGRFARYVGRELSGRAPKGPVK